MRYEHPLGCTDLLGEFEDLLCQSVCFAKFRPKQVAVPEPPQSEKQLLSIPSLMGTLPGVCKGLADFVRCIALGRDQGSAQREPEVCLRLPTPDRERLRLDQLQSCGKMSHRFTMG
jgi:hypothetical protein